MTTGLLDSRLVTPQPNAPGSSRIRSRSHVRRAKTIFSFVAQWVVAAVILIVSWTYAAPHVSRLFIVKPALVWDQIREWMSSGFLWNIVGTTLSEAGVGYLIGSLIGVGLALMVGLLPSIFGKVVEPVVVAVYAMPKFVIIPLLFVWLGAGFYPRIVLISLGIFAYIFVSTITGIRTVDSDQYQMIGMLGADRRQTATKLILPHTMGYISTGLTNAASHALTIAIGSEILFGATGGLGGVMYTESELFNARDVLAALVVATVIASIALTVTRQLGVVVAKRSGRLTRS